MTKEELEKEIEVLREDLDTYKQFMHVVRQKARSMREIHDPLYGVIRRYQAQLKKESLR